MEHLTVFLSDGDRQLVQKIAVSLSHISHTLSHEFSLVETARLDRIEEQLEKLNQTVGEIAMNVADAIQVLSDENVKLDDIGAKLTEGFAEITALIGQLQNTELTPEQETIVNNLQSKVDSIQPQAQQIADIVPNP